MYDDQEGSCSPGDFSGPYAIPPLAPSVKLDAGKVDLTFVTDNHLPELAGKTFNNKTWTYSVCPDVDECALNLHDCSHPNATCVNTPGSYKCICNPYVIFYMVYKIRFCTKICDCEIKN